MKFVDANIFLYAILDEGAPGKAARRFLHGVDPSHPAATTAVVLNEVMWNLRKPLGRGPSLAKSRQIATVPGLRILPVGEREWIRALELMEGHGHLKPNDALHAATAIEAGIGTIVSTDDDLDELPGLARETPP